MKNNSIAALVFFSLVLFSSCSPERYTIHRAPYPLPYAIGQIKIDSTYDLFVRSVSIHEEPAGQKKQAIKTLKINPPGGQASSDTSGKLIEIEYLFISYAHRTAFYISTVADRYKDRYAAPDFPGISRPNIADFRVFLIGTVDSKNQEKFTFYQPDGQHTDTWWLHKEKHTGDRLLYNIEQKRFASFEAAYPLEDDLASKLIFKKQAPGWEIIFKEAGKAAPPENIPDPVILFGKPSKKKYSIAFKLKDQVISFPGRFMIYSPERNIAAGN